MAGIKPLQSIMRVGTAAGQLLAIPAEALRGKPEYAYTKNPKEVPLSRQLQRGTLGALSIEVTSIRFIADSPQTTSYMQFKASRYNLSWLADRTQDNISLSTGMFRKSNRLA